MGTDEDSQAENDSADGKAKPASACQLTDPQLAGCGPRFGPHEAAPARRPQVPPSTQRQGGTTTLGCPQRLGPTETSLEPEVTARVTGNRP